MATGMAGPDVDNVKLASGVAGQISVSASVTYPDEESTVITFVGSVYGPPVVMVMPSGAEVFVTDPDRCGDFAADRKAWLRRFFGGV